MLLEKDIADAENKITELETKLADFEQELSTPEGAKRRIIANVFRNKSNVKPSNGKLGGIDVGIRREKITPHNKLK